MIAMAGEDKGVPVGALTGENRDIWTDVRRRWRAGSTSHLGLPL